MHETIEAEGSIRIAGGRIGWAGVRMVRTAVCIQEVAREEVLRAMQLQHAKQVAKLRQEMQATVQQMAEEQRGAMHALREQQTELYRQRAQAVEERRAVDVQVCAMVFTCIAAM